MAKVTEQFFDINKSLYCVELAEIVELSYLPLTLAEKAPSDKNKMRLT